MISSLIMGYWCSKRNAKEPLYLSTVLVGGGGLLYAYAEAFGKNGIFIVLGGRILFGLGAGILLGLTSVKQAYVSQVLNLQYPLC